jgi:8-oxo-dGTP pyrophosphatase MutT (NUDIX family)
VRAQQATQRSFDTVGWLHLNRGKLLLVRPHYRDVYYLPGGKPEAAETDRVALVREIHEELGVDLRPHTLRFFGEFTGQAVDEPTGTNVTIRCYLGGLPSSPRFTPGAEIAAWRFFSCVDYSRMSVTAPVVLDIMDALRAERTLE